MKNPKYICYYINRGYMIKELNKQYKLNKKSILNILLIIFVIGGIFGFIYETIFYKIDLGYFTKRGSTYGPWIPIYGFGSLLIILTTIKYNKKPLLVFLISTLVTGILEYLTGYILLNTFNLRLWDYNNEILNFGNINGFICLRSVLFFGISGLLLMYFILPTVIKIYKKSNKRLFNTISIILSTLFILDIIIYRCLHM